MKKTIAALVSLLCALLLLPAVGCAQIDSTSVPSTFAGVRYDPAAPLNPVLKPQFDEKDPPQVRTYGLRYQGATDAVPALLVIPSGNTPRPAVILLHGLGGNKTQLLPLATILAGQGYVCLCIDIAIHGDRPAIKGQHGVTTDLATTRTVVAQTVVDLRRAVDYLLTRPDVDKNRVGYMGVSFGGIIGTVFIANEPRIRTGVLWAAGGNWAEILNGSQEPRVHALRQRAGNASIASSEINTTLHDVDPLTYVAQIAPRPVLFINGDKDTIVPRATADLLWNAAKEPKKRILLPGEHIPDIGIMVKETITWLGTNLKSAK